MVVRGQKWNASWFCSQKNKNFSELSRASHFRVRENKTEEPLGIHTTSKKKTKQNTNPIFFFEIRLKRRRTNNKNTPNKTNDHVRYN